MQKSDIVLTQLIRSSAVRAIAKPRSKPASVFEFPPISQPIAALVAAVVLMPLVYLVIRAVGAGSESLDYLLRARTVGIITNSLLLTVAVTFSAALIGVPFAWLTTRAKMRFRRVWLILGLLPMVIPSYLGAVTLIAVFGPRGELQSLLEPLGVTRLPSIYGFVGAWLSVTLFTYPYVMLPVRAALMNLDPALEESAYSLGLSRWHVFRRVILPQLRPALAAGMLLAALYALSDFGAVTMMRYNVFTRAIYLQYTSSFDRSRAAVLALVLIVITLGILAIERRVALNMRNYRAGTGTQRAYRPVTLRRMKIPAYVFMGTVVTIGVIVPLVMMVSWLIRGLNANIVAGDLAAPLVNTVSASSAAALTVGLLSIPFAILAVRSTSHFNHGLVKVAYLGSVLPGLVVALALVFFATRYAHSWYQTFPILIVGYAIRFLPFSIGATRSAFTQINPRYEDAARCLGLNSWQVTWRITTPLARAGILAGMALVFLSVMKELPTTLLLAPTGFNTFATRIWSAYDAGSLARIGAPALILVAVSALSLYFILHHETYKNPRWHRNGKRGLLRGQR
ncbi:MAG: iron ABC transporter permease [Chloroflexi bacterium]|nr:MAG: iron ABC transporter permease [Chloroflexota bacterium]